MKQSLKNKMNDIKLLYPNEIIKLVGNGWWSTAFEVGKYIIRVPRTSEAIENYKKEEEILNFLKDKIKSVEIPSIKFVEKPFPYSIHEKLNGENWDFENYKKLSEKEKDKFANDVAIFFMELHSIKINDNLSINKALEVLEIEKYLSNEFTLNEITKLNNYINPVYSLKGQCFIHNDFYYENSLMNKKHRLKCMFDFSNAGYCNYHFEFKDLYSSVGEEVDMFKRITKYYDKKIDIEIIKIINVYNRIAICIYLAKNPKIKEEKIDEWNQGIEHVKKYLLIK